MGAPEAAAVPFLGRCSHRKPRSEKAGTRPSCNPNTKNHRKFREWACGMTPNGFWCGEKICPVNWREMKACPPHWGLLLDFEAHSSAFSTWGWHRRQLLGAAFSTGDADHRKRAKNKIVLDLSPKEQFPSELALVKKLIFENKII